MGTPQFAVESLQRLAQWPCGKLVAVYTQPDRPAGRGHKIAMPPVKECALAMGLPVEQPVSFKEPATQAQLAAYQPDIIVVAAYGLLLPNAVLNAPRLAPVNVHASLLPQFRGAAPIQRAIMECWQPDAITGVSIMKIVQQLDAGPVYARVEVPIGEHTAGSLHDTLARAGAELLLHVLDDLWQGTARPIAQDEAFATYAAKITRAETYLAWDKPVARIHARIRGLSPKPGAKVSLVLATGETLSLTLAPGKPDMRAATAAPGTLYRDGARLSVACVDGCYELTRVRLDNSRETAVSDLLNGRLRGLPQGACGFALAPEG